MNDKILFTGVLPALPTPIDKNENLIPGAIEKLVNFSLNAGVSGFYVCGATGEGPLLPVKTRMETLEAVMAENRGRGKIIAHVGGPNFTDVKTLARHARQCGADAVSAMAPNAYFPHSNREMVDYYKAIAEEAGLPLLVYVTPLMLGNDLTEVFEELISVPNIIGLKFTLKDYYLMSRLKMINGGNINVINGPDEMLISGLAMGADGGIGSTYNVMPDKFAALYQAVRENRMEDARKIQYEINKIIYVLIKDNRLLAALKCALSLMGMDMGVPVFPARPYTEEEAAGLRRDLIAAGLAL